MQIVLPEKLSTLSICCKEAPTTSKALPIRLLVEVLNVVPYNGSDSSLLLAVPASISSETHLTHGPKGPAQTTNQKQLRAGRTQLFPAPRCLYMPSNLTSGGTPSLSAFKTMRKSWSHVTSHVECRDPDGKLTIGKRVEMMTCCTP